MTRRRGGARKVQYASACKQSVPGTSKGFLRIFKIALIAFYFRYLHVLIRNSAPD